MFVVVRAIEIVFETTIVAVKTAHKILSMHKYRLHTKEPVYMYKIQ